MEIPNEILSRIIKLADVKTKCKLLLVNNFCYNEVKRFLRPIITQNEHQRILEYYEKDYTLRVLFNWKDNLRTLHYFNVGEYQLFQVLFLKGKKLHREDGPAEILWHPLGYKMSEFWYLDGVMKKRKCLKPPKHFIK